MLSPLSLPQQAAQQSLLQQTDRALPDPMTANPLHANLNPAQREAVEAISGPSLVLAGAGSGKTRVLTHKICHIIDSGAHPAEILAVTFTNKAAKEMQNRVNNQLGGEVGKGMWLGTFHSIAGRILRRDIPKYQAEPGRTWTNQFVIYDESDTIAVVKEALKLCNLDDKLYNPKATRYQISNFKNQLLTPAQFAAQGSGYRHEKLAMIYDTYEQLLCRNNALDFDDLLLKLVRLLQTSPELLTRYHNHFRHLLVDEFQDTNDSQYEIVRLLAEGCLVDNRAQINRATHWQNRSLTVVGDVDQSIYSWRGANFKIILNFQSDFPEAKLIKLEENYRSTGNILALANAVIENNSERLDKTLVAVRGEGPQIQCYEASDDRDEAYSVVRHFQKLIAEKNLKPSDCCVLYRTNAQSRSIEDVLMSLGIPYTVVGGMKFYERREIKDVMAYLTVIFNQQDSYSVKRVINVPKRGIGATTMQRLEAIANAEQVSLFTILERIEQYPEAQKKAQTAIRQFITLIQGFQSQVNDPDNPIALDDLVVSILEQTGYVDELRKDDPVDEEGRIQNLDEFVNVTKQYLLDNPDNADLAGFLTQMALLSDIDTADAKDNMLVLMTLHAAKGLEYKAVALVGMEEGLFPHSRSNADNAQLEEERRLLYVGITRAEEHLQITYARKRMVFGDIRYSSPSRFLKEMPAHLLNGLYTLDSEPSYDDRYSYSGPQNWERPARGSLPGRANERRASGDTVHSSWTEAATKPAPAVPVNLLEKGTRVRHPKFGDGTIEQLIGEGQKAIYSIQFDRIAGKKLLDPRFANLDIL
jgi:DNA helicase II / ATP-dependent DNA helicase PcrA